MKKRDSAVIVISLAFLLPFFVFQIKFFSNSRLNVNITDHSTKSHQGTTISKRVPQHDQHLYSSHQDRRIVYDRSHGSYDSCKVNGPTVLNPTTSTFFLTGPTGPTVVEKIRPYPRKQENSVMSRIEEVNLV